MFYFALILFFAAGLYAPALTVRFLFDDYPGILRNPFIKTLNPVILWQHDPAQFLTSASFALNYAVGGPDPVGWHVVNVLLHAATSFLLYKAVILLGQSPRLALCAALVFVALPFLQSTVIYVSHRSILIAALFYLGALCLFLKWRMKRQRQWIGGAVILAFAGTWMVSRQVWALGYPFWESILYLPAAVLTPFVSTVVSKITCRWKYGVKVLAATAVIFILAAASRQQVLLWQDPVVFLQHLNIQYPKNPRIYQELGQIYEEKNEFKQAEGAYNRSLSIDPEYFLTLNNLGFLYLKQGRLDLAQDVFERLRSLYPETSDPYVGLAYCYQKAGQLDRGLSLLQLAKRLNPHSPTVRAGLGNLYAALGQPIMAQDEYKIAIALDPEDALSYYNLANVFFAQKRFDAAMTNYEKALSLRPRLPEAHNNIGNIFFHFHDYKKAIEYYRHAIEDDPGFAQGHFNLANALYASGAVKESEPSIKTALDLFRRQNRMDMVQAIESGLKKSFYDPMDRKR